METVKGSRGTRAGTLRELITDAIAGRFTPLHSLSESKAEVTWERQQRPGFRRVAREDEISVLTSYEVNWKVFCRWARRNAHEFFPSSATIARWQKEEEARETRKWIMRVLLHGSALQIHRLERLSESLRPA